MAMLWNEGVRMNRCFTIGVIALGLMCGARNAHAASVVASLSGSPVTIQQGSSASITVNFTVSGSTNPNRNPAVAYCDTFTMNPDGTLTCSQPGLLSLNPGQNYTVRGTSTTFTRQITIVVPTTAPCGATYGGSVSLTSTAGTGLDFSGGILQVSLGFAVNVTCPAIVVAEGCGHGFWKTHPESWPAGYGDKALGDLFVLGGDFSTLSGDSLMTALNYGGGRTLLDKGKILLRNAAAAVLNDVTFGSSYTYFGQVYPLVDAALASETMETILGLETEFDLANNAYCPLP
jgi:hypothetical protein